MERKPLNLENKIQGIIDIWRRERTLASEGGHRMPSIDEIPQDQEIVLFTPFTPRECLDTKVFDHDPYNQSVSLDWLQIDPAEDGTSRRTEL